MKQIETEVLFKIQPYDRVFLARRLQNLVLIHFHTETLEMITHFQGKAKHHDFHSIQAKIGFRFRTKVN